MSDRVLIVSTNRKTRDVLPTALRLQLPESDVDVVSRVTEAVERLAAGSYDVVVCCADQADELAILIRLKKRAPDMPVVVLSRVPERGFESLARSMGADAFVQKSAGLDTTTRALARAVEAARMARHLHGEATRSKELAREVRRLAAENRDLISMALGLAASDEPAFTTLLVDDDSHQTAFFVRMMTRAKLPPFVRTVDHVDAAIAYLEGKGRYSDRELNPFPALIVSDLNMPLKSGLDLLRWVRSNPASRQLGFVMLTSSEYERDIEAAYEGGANLYLVKSDRMQDVIDIVRAVYMRYMAEKTGSKPA